MDSKSPRRGPGSKSLFYGDIESPGHLVVYISGDAIQD